MKPDRLSKYRAKRSADRTPEPFGAAEPSGAGVPLRFVVQKHAARRLHYDFRLELDGVLLSWAVPQGPSYDQANKRLAVHVEDHPLDYADFEGVIPPGNYGAGQVIVWDTGLWRPIEDPRDGLEKGKLLFELEGYKLRGRWTLVKMKKTEKEWLLIKERDGLEGPGRDDFSETSVYSGLSIEDLATGADRAAEVRKTLEKLGAKAGRVKLPGVRPMLAGTREKPFRREGWLFELKYDGWRLLVEAEGGDARLFTRNGKQATHLFPEVARALASLPFPRVVLDGEVVVLDEAGRPSFGRLQERAQLTREPDIRRAAAAHPATLFVFDLLAFDELDTRPLPLVRRKEALRRIVPAAGPVRYADHVETEGEAFYAGVERMGLEGIMAKREDSPYRSGRSEDWLKIRADRTGDFAVVGYTQGKGSRGAGFGALHLAFCADDGFVYAGRVGTGFSQAQIEAVTGELERHRRKRPVFDLKAATLPATDARASIWVRPTLVAEVRYREWTRDGLLRHPVFLRFREDKRVEECDAPVGAEPDLDRQATKTKTKTKTAGGTAGGDKAGGGEAGEGEGGGGGGGSAGAGRVGEESVAITNPDKVFWPEDGYTKADLVDYYRSIAPWLLPYLKDRPVVLTRYPDGIHGKSFFQKDAPAYAPDWLRRVRVWSDDSQRELNYFVIDSEQGLIYLANMAAIPLHIWSSRVGALERPDWCILDLDPKGAPFQDVIDAARALHRICKKAALPCFVKTSGSTGLHVLVPLGGSCTHEQARQLGELLARLVVRELPETCTIARQVSRRGGKVYVDYLQNGHGKLLAAPFSARPLEGAPVSMPLKWTEVRKGLSLGNYTIRTAPARMKKLKRDPLVGVLTERPDLVGAIERLGERLATG